MNAKPKPFPPFRPAQPSSEPGQAAQRRQVLFVDQHGREWDATVEVRSGGACSPFHARFHAPMYPPDKYVVHDPNDSHKVKVDYNTWEQDNFDAMEAWRTQVRRTAVSLGVQGTVIALSKNPPPEILDIVGQPPRVMAAEVIQSARAGNRWILFGEGEMPKKAEPYFQHILNPKPKKVLSDPNVDPFDDGTSVPTRARAKSEAPAQRDDAGDAVVEPHEYTWKMGAPGRWKMPDDNWFQGTEQVAKAVLQSRFPRHYDALFGPEAEAALST